MVFQKKQIPWNKGTKGVMKANKTSFKKGNHPKTEFKKGQPKPNNAFSFSAGSKHIGWKGGKPRCIDCGKRLASYMKDRKRCYPCFLKFNIGKNNHNWKGGRPTIVCEVCSKKFLGYNHRISKYCSQECCGISKIIGKEAHKNCIHAWIKRRKPKPNKCELCGIENKKLDLANKDHTYKRNLEDYFYVCRSCHRKFDIKYNNYKTTHENIAQRQ